MKFKLAILILFIPLITFSHNNLCFNKQNLIVIKEIIKNCDGLKTYKYRKFSIERSNYSDSTSCNGLYYLVIKSKRIKRWVYLVPLLRYDSIFQINCNMYLGENLSCNSFSLDNIDFIREQLTLSICSSSVDELIKFFMIGIQPRPILPMRFLR